LTIFPRNYAINVGLGYYNHFTFIVYGKMIA
jgi:hypothetical protein